MDLIYVIDLFGTFVFAISGVIMIRYLSVRYHWSLPFQPI